MNARQGTMVPHAKGGDEDPGARVCGLRLGVIPQTFKFKKFATEPAAQRESCMVYVKYLREPQLSAIYPPSHHLPMIRRIYDHLDAPMEARQEIVNYAVA